MYFLLPRQDDPLHDKPPNKPAGSENPDKPNGEDGGDGGGDGGGMSPVGVAMLVLFLLLLVAGVSYVVYTQLRARRLGLPTPGWRSYVPFMNNSGSRSRPATGPLGWMKSKLPGGSGGGGTLIGGPTGYTGASERSRRTHTQFGQLRQEDDEAWDARGYNEVQDYDDTELQQSRGRNYAGEYSAGTGYGNSGLGPRGHELDDDGEPPRGRSRSREPPYQNQPKPQQQKFNPRGSMDSFTGVSVRGGRGSIEGERRSVFREAM
ncbi:hypothetical protein BDZ91DRAFT_789978 [Kalaharituber pfeilii]|nr:hypothetical protein BDZ91DRAFT_789978 [Kalaharituber pfeilii]